MDETKVGEMLSSQGKFDWLQSIRKEFKKYHKSTDKEEDDAATILQDKRHTLISTKLFLDAIHFDLTYFPLKHLGYKIVSITISDILAMNGIPTHLMIHLGVSNRFSLAAVEEIMFGVKYCCQQYKLDLIQLDVEPSCQGLVASVTAYGEVEASKKVLRDGAKENDLICVSGDLAAAYAGLLLLEREKKVFQVNPQSQPDFAGYDYLLERQLKPEPRFDIIKSLKESDIQPSAMTHVTHGLAAAAIHICRASQVGCRIFEEKLPIDILTFQTLKELNIVPTTIALNGGDDNEIVFTISQSDYEKISGIKEISVIGYIKDKNSGCNLITNDEKQIPLTAQEFSPFSTTD